MNYNLPPGTGSLPGEDDNNPFEYIDATFWWSMFKAFDNQYDNFEDFIMLINEIKDDDKAMLAFAKELFSLARSYQDEKDGVIY